MSTREPIAVDGVLLGVGEDDRGHAFIKLRVPLDDAQRLMDAGAFLQRAAVRFPAPEREEKSG